MNTEQLSFGQRIDSENGLVECWFTHGALDWIKQQDWSDKVVWMYGAGYGDGWLAKRCKKLYVVERNDEWYDKCINSDNDFGISYEHRPCNDCSGMAGYYVPIPDGINPDVIIVDDAYRYECIMNAINVVKPKILIVDNYNQDYVFICPAAVEALEPFKKLIFEQENHTDHEGNKWKTGVFFIDKDVVDYPLFDKRDIEA